MPREFLAVATHPHIVPAEHPDRGEQDAGVEQFLAHAGGRSGDRGGTEGDADRPQHSGGDAGGDPEAAPQGAAACRQHDADNQRRLENFAKDDDCSRQHQVTYLTTTKPRVLG